MKHKTAIIGKTRLPVNQGKGKFVPPKQPIVGYEEILSRLAFAVKYNNPVLLIGETGVGKTALVRHLANRTNNNLRRMNLNGQTTIDEFTGKILLNKRGTYWVDGILTDALRNGYWVLLDEVNAALPEILFVLHSLLDDDRYIVLSEKDGEIVRPHKNFRLFAGMNPSGKYAGTKDLNKAFLSRFPMILRLDFPMPALEKNIVRTYAKKIDDVTIGKLVKVADDLRKSYKKDEIEFVCSTRDLINCALIAERRGIKEAVEMTLLNRCQEEDLKAVQTVVKLYFGDLKGGAPKPAATSIATYGEVIKHLDKQYKELKVFHDDVDELRDSVAKKGKSTIGATTALGATLAAAMIKPVTTFDPIAHDFIEKQAKDNRRLKKKLIK